MLPLSYHPPLLLLLLIGLIYAAKRKAREKRRRRRSTGASIRRRAIGQHIRRMMRRDAAKRRAMARRRRSRGRKNRRRVRRKGRIRIPKWKNRLKRRECQKEKNSFKKAAQDAEDREMEATNSQLSKKILCELEDTNSQLISKKMLCEMKMKATNSQLSKKPLCEMEATQLSCKKMLCETEATNSQLRNDVKILQEAQVDDNAGPWEIPSWLKRRMKIKALRSKKIYDSTPLQAETGKKKYFLKPFLPFYDNAGCASIKEGVRSTLSISGSNCVQLDADTNPVSIVSCASSDHEIIPSPGEISSPIGIDANANERSLISDASSGCESINDLSLDVQLKSITSSLDETSNTAHGNVSLEHAAHEQEAAKIFLSPDDVHSQQSPFSEHHLSSAACLFSDREFHCSTTSAYGLNGLQSNAVPQQDSSIIISGQSKGESKEGVVDKIENASLNPNALPFYPQGLTDSSSDELLQDFAVNAFWESVLGPNFSLILASFLLTLWLAI